MVKSLSPLMLFICQSINQVPRGVGHRNIGTGCHIPAIAVPVPLPSLERHGWSFRGGCLYGYSRFQATALANVRPDTEKAKSRLSLCFHTGHHVCHLRQKAEAKTASGCYCLTMPRLTCQIFNGVLYPRKP